MVYLLRHGEIESDQEKRFIGWTDVPLSEKGIRQAWAWQRVFSNTVFESIYCSDLRRARCAAGIVGEGRAMGVLEMPALREINLGELENLCMREFHRQFPETWPDRGVNVFSFRPDGGESFADLRERVIPVFQQIVSDVENDILIVAHAGVNRVILSYTLGMQPENLFRINQDYACLNKIDCRRRPSRVCLMNYRLPEEA
jgi:broad specificity phosphatase PhoE